MLRCQEHFLPFLSQNKTFGYQLGLFDHILTQGCIVRQWPLGAHYGEGVLFGLGGGDYGLLYTLRRLQCLPGP